MTYTQQVTLARVLAVVIAGIGLILAGNHVLLGITPQAAAWLAILAATLGTAASFLPSVRAAGRDPDKLADRISALPKPQRRKLAVEMANRARLEDAEDEDAKRAAAVQRAERVAARAARQEQAPHG